MLIANAVATRHGIRPGMQVSAAHALAHGLELRERDTVAEHAALARLAAWAGQFSSLVSEVPPQTLVLEIAASLTLFGGLERLLENVRGGLQELGYCVRLAVAPTPLAATWLARAGDTQPVTDLPLLARRLFALPLARLDLSAEQTALLRDIGLDTLGDCVRLPRDGLTRRLGPGFVTALDRAFGRLPDPRPPFAPPPEFAGSLALSAAVDDIERLLFALHRLVLELCGFLTARGAGVQRLTLRLQHAGAAVTEVHLGLLAPTRAARHLMELVRERLARLELAQPVETVGLHADTLLPLADRNCELFPATRPAAEAATLLLERLRVRLGRDAVRGLHLVAEHRPECAWRYAEPGAPGAAAPPIARPLWLLPAPVPLELRDTRPYLDGALALAPERERIESGWWDGADVRRDYYVARDHRGARLWVYRELGGAPRWWLHGIFG